MESPVFRTWMKLLLLRRHTGDLLMLERPAGRSRGNSSMSLCAGDRYVVVDCGGGTVDLTVHQIRLPEGHLKELYKASG